MIISEKLSKKISSDLTDRGLINKEYLESYAYSLEFLFDMILFNISLIILGAVLRRIIPAVIFIAVMTPIKTIAGGAHGRSRISCEIISYSIFLVIILLSAIISPDPVICFFLSALLASGIIMLSPVDTSARKRVSNNRKRLRILCIISDHRTYNNPAEQKQEVALYMLNDLLCSLPGHFGYPSVPFPNRLQQCLVSLRCRLRINPLSFMVIFLSQFRHRMDTAWCLRPSSLLYCV